MTSICFGGRPAGTIAILALTKTVDMGGDEFNTAKETVKRDTHVDYIIDSFEDQEECTTVTELIDTHFSRRLQNKKMDYVSTSGCGIFDISFLDAHQVVA